MSYTTETITAFATLLEAVKGLQPDTSEAEKLASKLITDQANAKNQAVAAIEAMKYGAFLKAQEKGNAYAIEMLSSIDPDPATDTRAFKELGKGGFLEDGAQLPFDQNQVIKDADEYFTIADENSKSDTKNAQKFLMYTSMDRNSTAAESTLLEAQSDLAAMISYRNDLYEKSKTLQNISDGQDTLFDAIPIIGSRSEMKLDKKIDSVIERQQALVDFLEG